MDKAACAAEENGRVGKCGVASVGTFAQAGNSRSGVVSARKVSRCSV